MILVIPSKISPLMMFWAASCTPFAISGSEVLQLQMICCICMSTLGYWCIHRVVVRDSRCESCFSSRFPQNCQGIRVSWVSLSSSESPAKDFMTVLIWLSIVVGNLILKKTSLRWFSTVLWWVREQRDKALIGFCVVPSIDTCSCHSKAVPPIS